MQYFLYHIAYLSAMLADIFIDGDQAVDLGCFKKQCKQAQFFEELTLTQ